MWWRSATGGWAPDSAETVSVGRRLDRVLHSALDEGVGAVLLCEWDAGRANCLWTRRMAAMAQLRGFAVVDVTAARSRRISPVRDSKDTDRRRMAWLDRRIAIHLPTRPVLVVVDGADCWQFADLRALTAAAFRSLSEPVVWLLTSRSDNAGSAGGRHLRGLIGHPAVQVISPQAVAGGDVQVGVDALLTGAATEGLTALAQRLGGRPGMLLQALLDLADSDHVRSAVRPGHPKLDSPAADFDRLPGAAILAELRAEVDAAVSSSRRHAGEELTPYTVADWVPRLGAAGEMLQVAAVLGASFNPEHLATMLEVAVAGLIGPLQVLLDAGLIRSAPEVFTFRHPLVQRAVLATVPPPLRMALRERARRLCLSPGHAAMPADEVPARDAEPPSERSVERTADGSGPAASISKSVAGEMAMLVRSGRLDQAVKLAESALANVAVDDDPDRLRAWSTVVRFLSGNVSDALHEATTLVDAGADASDASGPSMRLIRFNSLAHSDRPAAVAAAMEILANDDVHDDLHGPALMVSAMGLWREGRIDDAFDLLGDAHAAHREPLKVWHYDPQWARVWMLTKIDRLEEAHALLEIARSSLDTEQAHLLGAVPLAMRGWIHFSSGDLENAAADAAAATNAARWVGLALFEPMVEVLTARIAIHKGDLAGAVDRLPQLRCFDDVRHPWWAAHLLLRAMVEDFRQGPRAALLLLRNAAEAPETCRDLMLEGPGAMTWCVRTALTAGDHRTAARFVDVVEALCAASPGQAALAVVARHVRALIDRREDVLAACVDSYRYRWQAAFVHEDRATLLAAKDGDAAVEALETAMATFQEHGAELDVGRVRRKLRGLGVRRRHWTPDVRADAGWSSLTDSEEKVAKLVAQGLTNRQVATALFVSPHTVDFHLRQIYRKLQVRSRVELARISPARQVDSGLAGDTGGQPTRSRGYRENGSSRHLEE